MNTAATIIIGAVSLGLLTPSTSRGQQDSLSAAAIDSCRHSFGVVVGFNDVHQKDEYLSPMIFSNTFYAVGISYESKTLTNRHAIEASYGSGRLDSDIQPRDVFAYVGYFSYAYTHVVDTWNIGGNPLAVSLGAGLSTFVTYTDFNATDKLYNVTTYDQSWYWAHAVDFRLRGEYSLGGERSISFQLAAPLAQLVSRPGNGHYFNNRNAEVQKNFLNAATQGKLEFLWGNVAILGECEYRHRIIEHLDVRGIYRFRYASSDRPLPFGMYMNTVVIGLLWVI